MRLACEIQSIARRMQSRANKDELSQEVAKVTLETHKLQEKIQEVREVFADIENMHAEAGGCCFPFKYIMLRDLVHDVNDLSVNLQHKWYGATDQQQQQRQANGVPQRGVVNRLLENCRAFSANRQALNRYDAILQDLHGLKYKDLEQTLQDRQTRLTQQQVVFAQLQDLLKQLQDLHRQSQTTWLAPRYFMLQRGVLSSLVAFRSVAGLADSSLPPPQQSSPSSSAGTGTTVHDRRTDQTKSNG